MELGKRQTRSTLTQRPLKKMRFDSSISYTRVYYSSSFDLFNFADSMYLEHIAQKFPNCHLIVGIENDDDDYVMSLEEREESLKQCQSIRQILHPAPKVDLDFLQDYEIDYVCCTPDTLPKYKDLDLGEKLVELASPIKLSRNDLILRVISARDQFLDRCLSKGYDRRQLNISQFKQLKLKLKNLMNFSSWEKSRFKFIGDIGKKGKKLFKKVSEKIEFVEDMIKKSFADDSEESESN